MQLKKSGDDTNERVRRRVVILTTHDDMTLATLDTGIQRILLLATEPGEITAVDGELLESRQDPTHHLFCIVSLGMTVIS